MKRKSVAQMRNEIAEATTRLQAIEDELKALTSGEVSGNPKTIEKKIKDLKSERIRLQHTKKRLEDEFENLENV